MVFICGYKKRVGKDTFYLFLKELLPNKNVVRVAFADALKDEVAEIVLEPSSFTKDSLDDNENKPIFRTLKQWWGTEFRRNPHPKINGDPDHWINIAIQNIKKLQEQDPNCVPVICDGRFPNEIIKTKDQLQAKSIMITRDSVFDANDQHSSETALDNHRHLFDFVIDNDGSLDEYKEKVRQMLPDLMREF